MSFKTTKDLSKTSSTDGGSPIKEENFVDALISQVDEDSINEVITIQKKALERFEKTNEILVTCVALSEKRLDRTKAEFVENKKLLVNAKRDLEFVFRTLRNIKHLLATKYPEIYKQIAVQNKPPADEE